MKIPCLLLLTMIFCTSPVLAFEETSSSTGVTKNQAKILGGIEAKTGDWPWIAALLYSDVADMFQAQFCGGSLIDDTWILTAAHCVNGMSSSELNIAVGVFDLANFSGSRISVKNIRIHPQYDATNSQNDVALLELNQPSSGPTIPLFIGESLEKVPLSLLGKMLTAIGWGMADSVNSWYYPEKLRQVELPVVDDSNCNAIHSPPLTASQICAGYYDGKDVCNGDSGGPIVTKIDETWIHVGLTSYGSPCDTFLGWYGVYTRTSSYIDFIKQYVPGATFWTTPKTQPWLMLLLNDN